MYASIDLVFDKINRQLEKAISIPSITKLVISENPPWLTNGSVIPVIGNARVIPPTFTNA